MLAGSQRCEFRSQLWLDSDSFKTMMEVLKADCEIDSKRCVETEGFKLDNTSEPSEGGCRRQVKRGAEFEDVFRKVVDGKLILGRILPATLLWNTMQAMDVCKWGSRAGYLFAAGTELIRGLRKSFDLGKADIKYDESFKLIKDLGDNPVKALVEAKAELKADIESTQITKSAKAGKQTQLDTLKSHEEDLAVTYARASIAFIRDNAAKSNYLEMLINLGMDRETAMVIYSLAPAYREDGKTKLDELCVSVAVEKLVENKSISRSWGDVIIAFKKIIDISAAIQEASESEDVKEIDSAFVTATATRQPTKEMIQGWLTKRMQAIRTAIGEDGASKLVTSYEEAVSLLTDLVQITTAQSALVNSLTPLLTELNRYVALLQSATQPDTKSDPKKSERVKKVPPRVIRTKSSGGKASRTSSKTNYEAICRSTIVQRAQNADLRAAYAKAVKEGKCK